VTTIYAWEAMTNELLWTHSTKEEVHLWCVCSGGSKVVIIFENDDTYVVATTDLTNGAVTEFATGWSVDRQLDRTAANNSGTRVFVLSRQTSELLLDMWDLASGSHLFTKPVVGLRVLYVGDGHQIVARTLDGINVWDTCTGHEVNKITVAFHKLVHANFFSIVLSEHTQRLCAGWTPGFQSDLQVWDIVTGATVFMKSKDASDIPAINTVCFTASDTCIVAAESDLRGMLCWRIEDGETVFQIRRNEKFRSMSYQQHGSLYLFDTPESSITEIEPATGCELARSKKYNPKVNRLYIAPPVTILL
jgi:WD40 repeat protein